MDVTTLLSRNSASLVWRGQSQDKMKAGCQASGILLAGNGLIGVFGIEHVLMFKKGKNDPKGRSEACGHCHQGPRRQAQEVGWSPSWCQRAGQPPPFHIAKPASSSSSASPPDFPVSVVSLSVTQVQNLSLVTPFLSLNSIRKLVLSILPLFTIITVAKECTFSNKILCSFHHLSVLP